MFSVSVGTAEADGLLVQGIHPQHAYANSGRPNQQRSDCIVTADSRIACST